MVDDEHALNAEEVIDDEETLQRGSDMPSDIPDHCRFYEFSELDSGHRLRGSERTGRAET